METIRISKSTLGDIDLEIIYNKQIYFTNITDFSSNFITIDQLEQILQKSSNSKYVLNFLTCTTEYNYIVFNNELIINLNMIFDNPPLKLQSETLQFTLKNKISNIDDKFDILLYNFENKLNVQMIRKNSKNKYLKFNKFGMKFDDKIIWNLSHHPNKQKPDYTPYRQESFDYYQIADADIKNPPVFLKDFLKYVIPDKIYSEISSVFSNDINLEIFKYASKNFSLNWITKTLQYIFDTNFVNFIKFDSSHKLKSSANADDYDKYSYMNDKLSDDYININYNFIINVQLDRKPVHRKIYLCHNIETFSFDLTKEYIILDTTISTTFTHYIIEEL